MRGRYASRAAPVTHDVRSHRDSRYTMNKQLNIFLLIGQSNMYGCGDIAEVRPLKHPQVSMYQGGQWIPASDPLHVDAPDDPRVGLGMSFATALLNTYPNAEIGLLQCAVGGTPLSRWSPGADLYDNAVDLIRRASSGGILKGILWHQGESDSDTETAASTYGSRLIEMIESLRTDLAAQQTPVISGELGRFLAKTQRFVFYDLVNRQLNELGDIAPLYGCVSSEGLRDYGDSVHFNAQSLYEFGTRYAQEYLRIIEDNNMEPLLDKCEPSAG